MNDVFRMTWHAGVVLSAKSSLDFKLVLDAAADEGRRHLVVDIAEVIEVDDLCTVLDIADELGWELISQLIVGGAYRLTLRRRRL